MATQATGLKERMRLTLTVEAEMDLERRVLETTTTWTSKIRGKEMAGDPETSRTTLAIGVDPMTATIALMMAATQATLTDALLQAVRKGEIVKTVPLT